LRNKILFYWTCEKSENSGEGKLALFFLKKLRKQFNLIEIKKPKIKNKFFREIFNYRYILPFIGVLYCWKYYLTNKKACYVNYLPFWNFLIFLFLPPGSIIGPITGGANFINNSNFIRKVFFPIFYKISEVIVNVRSYKLIFSTDLIKKFLFKKTIKKSSFNFVIENFSYEKKEIKKTIDFLIYFREHKNKKKFFPYKLIKNLMINKFKINIVGDKLKIPNIVNHGFIKNTKLKKLQQKTKFTIFSEENLYSIFTLECIKNHVYVLVDKTKHHKLTFFKKSFIKINFDKPKELHKLKKIYKRSYD